MPDYEFILPFPPSVNVWKTAFRGRMILTKKGRDYRRLVLDRMSELGLSNERLSGRLSVSIDLHGPTNAKRDIDNFLKSPLDALTHCGFWVDDEQIDSLKIVRRQKVKGGELKVSVSIIDS